MTRARRRRRYWARRQARRRPRGFTSTDYFAPPYAQPAGTGAFHCSTLIRLPGDLNLAPAGTAGWLLPTSAEALKTLYAPLLRRQRPT